MRSKKEIDRDYYLRNKEKILKRVAQYQKEYPESHREAAREYERRKARKIKIIGKIVPDEKLGNKVIYSNA